MDSTLLDRDYFFRDLTAIGKPRAGFSDIISDQSVQAFDSDRYSFYMHILKGLMDPDSKGIVDTVLSVGNMNEMQRQDIQDRSKEIANALSSLHSKYEEAKYEKAREEINRALEENPTINGVSFVNKKLHGGGETSEKPKESTFFSELRDRLKKEDGTVKVTDEEKERILDEYNNHVTFSSDNEKITATDRVIFIAVTFVWRGLALFVVQWALNAYMIRNFNQALMLYIATYLGLFLLWVLLTNAADGIFLFKLLFYYVSVNPHGYGRILIHALLQLLMIPIPSIINNNKNAEVPFTFEESRRIFKAISSFTMFMWLFTSLVAVKY